MIIKIIDYKAGNAPSVMHALTHLGYKAYFAYSPRDLENATHIILPGVGSAKATMDSLTELDLTNALEDFVLRKKSALFLGICVGMQILFEHSEEGDVNCLGWLKGEVVKFDVSNIRVPQMGWNMVRFTNDSLNNRLPSGKSLSGVEDNCFYFVNSYYAKPQNESDIWGVADYGGQFTAAVCRDNIYATQFHAEKSGEAGLSLLKSFCNLKIQADIQC